MTFHRFLFRVILVILNSIYRIGHSRKILIIILIQCIYFINCFIYRCVIRLLYGLLFISCMIKSKTHILICICIKPRNIKHSRMINEYRRLCHKKHAIFTIKFLRQYFCFSCCIVVIIQANIFLPDILFLILLIHPFSIGGFCIFHTIEGNL